MRGVAVAGAGGCEQVHNGFGEGTVREAWRSAGGVWVLLRAGLWLGGGRGATGLSEAVARKRRRGASAARVSVPGGAERINQSATGSPPGSRDPRGRTVVHTRHSGPGGGALAAECLTGVARGAARDGLFAGVERYDVAGDCGGDGDAAEHGGIALSLCLGEIARAIAGTVRKARMSNANR